MPKDDVTVMYIEEKLLSKEFIEDAHALGLSTKEVYLMPIMHKKRFFALAKNMKDLVDNSNMGAKWEVSEDLIIEFKRILASLNYLINSTSFDKGDKYYDFDKTEIDKKLGRNPHAGHWRC